MTVVPRAASILEWGLAAAALEGDDSGDLHVVVESASSALVGAIDGLGHGPEAAVAAHAAAAILRAHAHEDVQTLVQRCHEGLRKTRGVVMTLAAFDARASLMTWIGIGNVDGVLLRAGGALERNNEALAVRGGVVGLRLPPLRAWTLPVSRGDTLILATDGVRSGFSDGAMLEREPQGLAQSIMDRYLKGSDDALVVVARYLGAAE